MAHPAHPPHAHHPVCPPQQGQANQEAAALLLGDLSKARCSGKAQAGDDIGVVGVGCWYGYVQTDELTRCDAQQCHPE